MRIKILFASIFTLLLLLLIVQTMSNGISDLLLHLGKNQRVEGSVITCESSSWGFGNDVLTTSKSFELYYKYKIGGEDFESCSYCFLCRNKKEITILVSSKNFDRSLPLGCRSNPFGYFQYYGIVTIMLALIFLYKQEP